MNFHSENRANRMKRLGEIGQKCHFGAKFWPKMRLFAQNPKLLLFDHYWSPTSWNVSKKSNERFSRKSPNGRTWIRRSQSGSAGGPTSAHCSKVPHQKQTLRKNIEKTREKWATMWPPKKMTNLPNMRFHYFLAQNQISGGFIAPFGQKHTKLLFMKRGVWPPKGQDQKRPPKLVQKYSTHPHGSYEVLTLTIGPFLNALSTFLTLFDKKGYLGVFFTFPGVPLGGTKKIILEMIALIHTVLTRYKLWQWEHISARYQLFCHFEWFFYMTWPPENDKKLPKLSEPDFC